MSDGGPGVLRNALTHMKNMLMSPIKAYGSSGIPDSSSMISGFGHILPQETSESEQGTVVIPEGDLPSQITRFMGKSKSLVYSDHSLKNQILTLHFCQIFMSKNSSVCIYPVSSHFLFASTSLF